MAELRQRPLINYLELAKGPSLPHIHAKRETWSTKKLYDLTVSKSKLEDGVLKVFVHYTGWASAYDEWRDASDILDIPEEYLFSNKETKKLCYYNLRIAIKESLHGQRKVNSVVEVHHAIQRDVFDDFVEVVGIFTSW